jgi:hypothetical protein
MFLIWSGEWFPICTFTLLFFPVSECYSCGFMFFLLNIFQDSSPNVSLLICHVAVQIAVRLLWLCNTLFFPSFLTLWLLSMVAMIRIKRINTVQVWALQPCRTRCGERGAGIRKSHRTNWSTQLLSTLEISDTSCLCSKKPATNSLFSMAWTESAFGK